MEPLRRAYVPYGVNGVGNVADEEAGGRHPQSYVGC